MFSFIAYYQDIKNNSYLSYENGLCLLVLITFILMFLREFYVQNDVAELAIRMSGKLRKHLFLSSLVRYLIYLLIFYIPYLLVTTHYYFQTSEFDLTRIFYNYIFYSYVFLGFPYIYLTLKLKGEYKYDFNDYAILTLIGLRSVLLYLKSIFLGQINNKRGVKNHRVKKVCLVILVNFFFLTLMTSFLDNQFNAFLNSMNTVNEYNFGKKDFYFQYHAYYLLIYHLIFVIDVCIAIIGYTVASRWLDNRTKSVDMSLYGWFVVLVCYPPMNSGFTSQFIGFNNYETHAIINSDIALMVIMFFIICCFIFYVWATVALGFKFSNLTNRGVVTNGPYAYVRHPAYVSKNIAWWLDNIYVLTSLGATISLLMWNIIYIMRGLTEEQHLSKDPEYQRYMKVVKYRFLPFKNC